jgi:hypothetical protein
MITTRNAIIASAFPRDDDVERKVDDIFKRKHPVLEQNSYLLTDDIKSKLDWIENAYQPENHFPKGKWDVEFSDEDSKNAKQELEALRDQLNIDYDEIVQKHEKVAGQGVPRIPR